MATVVDLFGRFDFGRDLDAAPIMLRTQCSSGQAPGSLHRRVLANSVSHA
jgi:hypothetical protein